MDRLVTRESVSSTKTLVEGEVLTSKEEVLVNGVEGGKTTTLNTDVPPRDPGPARRRLCDPIPTQGGEVPKDYYLK